MSRLALTALTLTAALLGACDALPEVPITELSPAGRTLTEQFTALTNLNDNGYVGNVARQTTSSPYLQAPQPARSTGTWALSAFHAQGRPPLKLHELIAYQLPAGHTAAQVLTDCRASPDIRDVLGCDGMLRRATHASLERHAGYTLLVLGHLQFTGTITH